MAGDKGYMFNPLLRHGFQKRQGGSGGGADPSDLDKKVDKYQGGSKSGMVLYVDPNGFVGLRNVREITVAERNKLAGLPSEIPTYGIDEVDAEGNYLKTYQLYSVTGGKKTYLSEKINIPKDLHIRTVEVVTVSDTHPVPGYENGKYLKYVFVTEGGDVVQMINVNDLYSYVLEAGDHVNIDKDVVSAHSFVPEYDSVSKVLPSENIFHYIGPDTAAFKHGYFYERGQGFVVKAGTNKGNIYFQYQTQDYLQGTFWDNGESDIELYLYENAMRYGDDGNWGDDNVSLVEAGVGDVISTGNVDVVVTAVESDGSVRVQGMYGDKLATSHQKFARKLTTRQFVSEDGSVVLYYAGYMSLRWIYCPDNMYKTSQGFVTVASISPIFGSGTLTHDIVVGSQGWQQLNVQPTADFSEIDSRLDDLETDSHKQNTDTMLNNGTLKVESKQISATLPIVSTGDIQGSDTSGMMHLLSKKLDASMLRTYNSFDAMVADKANIPQGAWCAIIE